MKEEVIITHKGCGGECYISDVRTHEYYGGDVKNSYVEYRCRKCNKNILWEDIGTEGF